MKLGIIGLGYWGPNIVRNAVMNPDINRIVCCDQNPERLQAIRKTFETVEITQDADALLKDPEIDAVAIITPVYAHYELAKKALLAGKHILVEKPFMSSVAQSEEILALAQKQNLVVMVDHTFIYTPAVRKIKELYTTGVLGDLYYFDSVRVNLGLFQRDVNVIWDLAPHDFSIMHHIIGKRPVSVRAMGADHVGKGIEDVAYVHVEFENNLIAHFHINWLSPVKVRRTLIAGTKKMVLYDDMENVEKVRVFDKGIEVESREAEYQMLVNYRAGEMYSPVLDNTEALKALIQEFVDSVRENRKPLTSGEDGLEVVRILEATQESIKNDCKKVYI